MKSNVELLDLPSELPVPLEYRILVQPFAAPEKTAGGIILTPKDQANIGYLSCVGKILKMGPGAYQSGSTKFKYDTPDELPKEGDFVLFANQVGQKVHMYSDDESNNNPIKLIIMNDDQVLGIIKDPTKYQIL